MIVVFNQNATGDIVQQLVRALKFNSTAIPGPHSVAVSVSSAPAPSGPNGSAAWRPARR